MWSASRLLERAVDGAGGVVVVDVARERQRPAHAVTLRARRAAEKELALELALELA